MDYVQPTDLLNEAVKAASRKVSLSVRDLLVRSFLAGGLLAYATSLVFIVLSQNIAPIVGAILFPVGFVILVLLGLELATGNFAILPAGWAAGEVALPGMFRNLAWVYLGNLDGDAGQLGLRCFAYRTRAVCHELAQENRSRGNRVGGGRTWARHGRKNR